MRNVARTLGYGLWYTHSLENTLTWYTDSDFIGSIDDRKKNMVMLFTRVQI